MQIKTLILGDLETNCYIVSIDNECLIIDPADDFSSIRESLSDKKVVGCLVTHFHFDHIGALEEVLSKYNLEINKVKSNKFKFDIIETPGHTIESKTFYFPEEKIFFSGDFLFQNSIGRTDLGGNNQLMKESLDKIESYPDDITIYPGHGPTTNLGNEKKNFSKYKEYL